MRDPEAKAKRRRAAGLGLALAGLLLAAGWLVAAKPFFTLDGAIDLRVSSLPFDLDRGQPDRTQFGRLLWRGGLSLSSPSRPFGGLSAISVDPSGGSLLALSDAGNWLELKLEHDGRKLKGVGAARMGPLLGRDGNPLATDVERDSEALAVTGRGPGGITALIGFERRHRIERYRLVEGRFAPSGQPVPLPKGSGRMFPNSGLEGLDLIRGGPLKGAVLAFAERLSDREGGLRGWLIGGPKPGALSLADIGGFNVTDLASLPNGDVLILERRFRLSEGVKMRIRRIAAAALKPGATLDGETLIELDQRYIIDNMEGIAVTRSAQGETIVTLMSDDNFSPFQRTLLMQFALPDAATN